FIKIQKAIKHTNLNHLLLMPKHYDLTQSRKAIDELLRKHSLFKKLYILEKSISPILSTLEESGLLISGEWFRSGLQEKQNQLVAVRNEINQMIGEAVSDQVDEDKLHHYWKLRELP